MSETMLGSLIVHAMPMSVAESRDGALAEASEALGGDGVGPAAVVPAAQPRPRGVKWWNVTTGSRSRSWHASIIRGSGRARARRELALLGFDARPLEREPVRAEARARAGGRGRRVAPEVVARVARHLVARGAGGVLPRPPVVVPVAALDLVRGGRRAPEEPVRERRRHGRIVGRGVAVAARPRPRPASGSRGKRRAVDDREQRRRRPSPRTRRPSASVRAQPDGRGHGDDRAADAGAERGAEHVGQLDATRSPTPSAAGVGLRQHDERGRAVRHAHPEPADAPRRARDPDGDARSTSTADARERDPDGDEHDARASPAFAGSSAARGGPGPTTPTVHVIVAGVSTSPTSIGGQAAHARRARGRGTRRRRRTRTSPAHGVAIAAGSPARGPQRPAAA